MSLARLVITAVEVEGRSKSEVARSYGLSRRWVQKLCLRYGEEGEAAFEGRSRRPHSTPNQTPGTVEDEIVALRKALAEEGLRRRAATIALPPRKTVSAMRRPSPPSGGSLHRRDLSPRAAQAAPQLHPFASWQSSPTSAGRPTSPTGTAGRGRGVEILNQPG